MTDFKIKKKTIEIPKHIFSEIVAMIATNKDWILHEEKRWLGKGLPQKFCSVNMALYHYFKSVGAPV